MLENGSVITFNDKQYTLLQSLGSGGQGSIWKIERQSDQAVFALKVVHIYDLRAGRPVRHRTEVIDDLIVRAQEEINFLSLLTDAETHHIVPCLEGGLIKDEGFELPAMLMPVYARDLTDLTSAYRDENSQGFDLKQLLDWIEQIASALSYIHSSGSTVAPRVHRDVKPGNLLLNEQGDIYLTDFGIVKAANHIGTTSIVYSYDFCAPEQRLAISEDAEGKRLYYITPAVDLYSLGMLIHELVAGSTRAQGELNDERNKNRHDRTLHDHKNKHERIGLLGEIGGLTEPEKGHLHRQLQHLSGIESMPDTTVIAGENVSLPQSEWVTFQLTDFIARLLAPWPDERPDATATLLLIQQIRQALNPELKQFELLPKQLQVQQSQHWIVHLKLRGKGLPTDLRWIKASINQQAINRPDFQLENSANYDFLLPSDQDLSLKLILPGTETLGTQTLKVIAYVAEKPFSASAQREVKPCAEYLWQNSKRAEALLLDLRSDWLNQWQQEASKTLTQRYEFARILEVLQKRYPDNSDLKQRRVTLEKLDSGSKKQWWIAGLLSFAMLLITVASIIKLQTNSNEKPVPLVENIKNVKKVSDHSPPPTKDFPVSISQMATDLFMGTEAQQSAAWLRLSESLKQYPDHPKFTQAKDLKKRYEQETEEWLGSSDLELQRLAVTRLRVLGNAGDSNAQAWLGYFYLSGQIVEKNIETAKQWYQKAAAQSNPDAIQQLDKLNGSWKLN